MGDLLEKLGGAVESCEVCTVSLGVSLFRHATTLYCAEGLWVGGNPSIGEAGQLCRVESSTGKGRVWSVMTLLMPGMSRSLRGKTGTARRSTVAVVAANPEEAIS